MDRDVWLRNACIPNASGSQKMWGTKRLPACDCVEHRLEAYAAPVVRHSFFARCEAVSAFAPVECGSNNACQNGSNAESLLPTFSATPPFSVTQAKPHA
ncbi:hypothetical protein RB7703 [Rhodopirellula baltica SH 1]|uniref:Uncharacterized protein n=1 Tax=Rhodopirellula baltica (strain DSM 10527 / NCIMB 13988 / SH1) TaxID=243090 RepID=Q7UNA0_RHOBA|nr:hypothetical protein RB7703 [Rhodopirellula baltica SH 1]